MSNSDSFPKPHRLIKKIKDPKKGKGENMIAMMLENGEGPGIYGKAINEALKRLPGIMEWHCEIRIENKSYKFIPRRQERCPREEIIFLLSKQGVQYLIKVVPLNPYLKYHELLFMVFEYKRQVEGKWAEVSHNNTAEANTYEILCMEIATKVLIFL